MVNENTEKDLRVIEELSPSERKSLKAFIKGYGRLKYASQLSGLERRTIERIVIVGSGLRENVQLIRDTILNKDTSKDA